MLFFLLFSLGSSLAESHDNSAAQQVLEKTGYNVDANTMAMAMQVFDSPEPNMVFPNPHPQAQWFKTAGLGFFMHWGIHSTAGIQPSWAMIKDFPSGYDPNFYPPQKYFALADKFNPCNYDPAKWIAAAKSAGFTYAVLTVKHHDGYALWPTRFGNFSTRQYLNGKDLLQPYVDACRNNGIKVGFYFSQRDWHYPGYCTESDFDWNQVSNVKPINDADLNYRNWQAFYAYTLGQLNEILTNYGQIDLLWFDGIGWNGVTDLKGKQTYAWIRKLQPAININDRWSGVSGDFSTAEHGWPEKKPQTMWERCMPIRGHWGFDPKASFMPAPQLLAEVIRARSWGGNYLANVGPAPDGTMPAGFYDLCRKLASWKERNGQAIYNVHSNDSKIKCEMPITVGSDNCWYVHCLGSGKKPKSFTINIDKKPIGIEYLRTGQQIGFQFANSSISAVLPANETTDMPDVVKITW